MTKFIFFRYSAAVISLGILFFCFCSKLGESTDLGSGVIDSGDPGKTSIDNYFHPLLLDSTYCIERFSVPFPGDTGFGRHSIPNDSDLYIGAINNEYSAGYFEILIARDTSAASFFFIPRDTLSSLQCIFSRDDVPSAGSFDLFVVDGRDEALSPDTSKKLATISFGDSSGKYDTVEIFDTISANAFRRSFRDSIFKACTTLTTDSTRKMDTLRFAMIKTNGTIDSLKGTCNMVLTARRLLDSAHRDSTLKVKAYASSNARIFVRENGKADSLRALPISSFLSKRTAVFNFSIDSLWRSIGGERVMITAGFLLTNPTDDEPLLVRCILKPEILNDGIVLDSLFTTDGSDFKIKKNTVVFASYYTSLQKWYDDASKPSNVYLYMRYINKKNAFKTVSLDMKPYFKAMITTP